MHRVQQLCMHACMQPSLMTLMFAGARAGIIPTDVFVNGTTGASYVSADGEW